MPSIFIFAGIWITGIIGWVANIYQMSAFGPVATWGIIEILKIVGIFVAPLGSVLGIVGMF